MKHDLEKGRPESAQNATNNNNKAKAKAKALKQLAQSFAFATIFFVFSVFVLTERGAWYKTHQWLVGINFIPSTAVNQLEMFNPSTFDPPTIDRELEIAAKLGMNTARVFLHDLLYSPDFLDRVDVFLGITKKHGIKPLLVLFDSCWGPYPKAGKQESPIPGVHNSRWVMSPGLHALVDKSQHARLEQYVRGVIRRFKNDDRILGWDIWNEAENGMSPENLIIISDLIDKSFQWARQEGVTQPLTTCLMGGDSLNFSAFQMMQINNSDILSFHLYSSAHETLVDISKLSRFNRPILLTEWLARPHCTVSEILPLAKKHKIGIFNWGLVDGKTQTKYPYDSIGHPYDHEPDPWHHDLFHKDGSAYSDEEVQLFQKYINE
ncbi:UNVERIFIED_CONTAM: hypothetical protein HDU68_001421 [Siphonaria sp. JEL0065]|nr:hypothetical protein HDU68_001421 [Siphonaria sp. JEL0065]